MSIASNHEGKKWIQTSVAIVCMLLSYVFMSFFEQINDWWHLETYISKYAAISQAVSVLIGLSTFIYIIKTPKTSAFLGDVFYEIMKVVWPEKNQTMRHTIGIMIGVSIVGFILGFFDFVATWALSLIS